MSRHLERAREIIEEWRKNWPSEGVYADFLFDGKFRMTHSPAESLAMDIAAALEEAEKNDQPKPEATSLDTALQQVIDKSAEIKEQFLNAFLATHVTSEMTTETLKALFDTMCMCEQRDGATTRYWLEPKIKIAQPQTIVWPEKEEFGMVCDEWGQMSAYDWLRTRVRLEPVTEIAEEEIKDAAKHEDSDGYFGFLSGARWAIAKMKGEK